MGGCIAWVDFGVFGDGLFSLRLDQSGCVWVVVSITHQVVGGCVKRRHEILKSRMVVVVA
jgi:hypothetical protein